MEYLNKFLEGSCFDLINQLPDESIDLIVTSPPYADIKSYGGNINVLHPDNYNDWIIPLMCDAYRVLKPSGSFVVNIGDKIHKKHRHTYALEYPVRVIRETELSLYDRYFWKRPGIPNGSAKRLNNFMELIYHFVKDVNKIKFNMDNVREEYKASSVNRYNSKMNFYDIRDDGTKVLKEQKMRSLNPKGKTPDGLFTFPNNSKMKGSKHPAPFHPDLPEWFIKALTDEGDVVLDTFMGSGSTAIAAMNTNRKWVGFELNPTYITQAVDRVEKEYPANDFF